MREVLMTRQVTAFSFMKLFFLVEAAACLTLLWDHQRIYF